MDKMKELPQPPKVHNKIKIILSLPRLAFTDNAASVEKVSRTLGIRVSRYTGAFWHYGVEELLEVAKKEKYKYALCIDYDTMFTEWHVIDLYELMEQHKGISALFPIQNKRGGGAPMLGSKKNEVISMDPQTGKKVTKVVIQPEELTGDIFECDSGHFGLTMIRLDDMKAMDKPWLDCKPGPGGSWSEGQIDADLYFWKNMKKNGLKVAMAHHVYIGHLQLMCTVAKPAAQGWQAHHVCSHDMITGQVPLWYVPKSFGKYTEEGQQLWKKLRKEQLENEQSKAEHTEKDQGRTSKILTP